MIFMYTDIELFTFTDMIALSLSPALSLFVTGAIIISSFPCSILHKHADHNVENIYIYI